MKQLNGRYETIHGDLASRGACIVRGGDAMTLCDAHGKLAIEFARSTQDGGFLVKRERPFKVHLWDASTRPCEAC